MTAQELLRKLSDAADYLGVSLDQIHALGAALRARPAHGGREVIVHLPVQAKCDVCKGTGIDPSDYGRRLGLPCGECGGAG